MCYELNAAYTARYEM